MFTRPDAGHTARHGNRENDSFNSPTTTTNLVRFSDSTRFFLAELVQPNCCFCSFHYNYRPSTLRVLPAHINPRDARINAFIFQTLDTITRPDSSAYCTFNMPTSHVLPESTELLQEIADALWKAKKVLVVTGAGISTNSGIPVCFHAFFA